MSDEQACLVAPRSDSESSGFGACKMAYTETREGEAPHALDTSLNTDGESGELIDYSDRGVLAQFNEEALQQAGCGPAQLRLAAGAGLALCGATVEQAVLPFILPSAEIEFCIASHEKSWLGMISLLGLCVGAVGWGNLADRGGRRRTLMSCLAVNAVFSTIAAFMPTYGTFMMARFCSAIGSGGIIPTVYSYVAELCTRVHRPRVLALLPLFVGAGGFYAGGLASAIVPNTGREAVIENKEHFSAWHRYLLLCALPIIASLVSLIWLDESPRYLLGAGREVEALTIYQSVHRRNRRLPCGKTAPQSTAGSDYRLGDLEPPSKRPRPAPAAVNSIKHNVKSFFQAFFQLFSGQYVATTATLAGTLFFTMCVHYAVSTYVPTTVAQAEAAAFDSARVTVANGTFENQFYTQTIENVEYVNSSFTNCTFRDMFLSHVVFRNCSFLYVTFANVKSSFTSFKGSLFVNSSMLETDFSLTRDLDAWCVVRGGTVRGMLPACPLRPDGSSELTPALTELRYAAGASAAAAGLAALPHRIRSAPLVLFAVCMLTPAIYFVMSSTGLYVLEALFKLLLTLAHFTVVLHVVESYPTNLRCTAHGFMMCLVYAGAMVTTSVYSNLGPPGHIPAMLVTAVLAVMATVFSLKTTDTAKHLL